jgi:pilus assembly protein Flp/PilA
VIDFLSTLVDLYRPATDDDMTGQSLVEYALIIVLIAIAVIVAMTTLGGQINTVFDRIRASLAN